MEHTTTQERATRAFEHSATTLSDTTAAYLEMNHRMIGDLTELSVSTAKENARLVAELQMAAIDALHESQAAVLRWQEMWPDALTDPLRWQQKALAELVTTTQRTLSVAGAGARVVMQAADRMQTAAVDTGRRVRDIVESSGAILRRSAGG
jgi:hypothetical protein